MKIAYCIKCGNKFPEEAVFCPYCGAKLYRSEDAKTDIRPEEVIVDIPIAPLPVEPEPQPVEQVEPIEPVVEPVIKEEEPQESEPVVDDVVVVEEPAPVVEPKTEPETAVEPEAEVAPEAPAEQADVIDEDELEDPKIGICILSFFFPIVGFIAAGSNRGTNKKKSKTYAMWAWIGFAIGFISKIIQSAI